MPVIDLLHSHSMATPSVRMRAASWLFLAAAAFAGCAAPRPNVVMIVADDQGWTDFGFAGHPTIRTPHLDRLAAESALFPNGSVPTSLCRASLATLLTGLYAHQHKICCNDPPEGVDRAAMHPFIRNAPTVPRLLGAAGYRSLQTGKFWEGHYANAGFTEGMTLGRYPQDRHGGPESLAIGRQTMQPIYDFIDGCAGRPFFVWYAPMMPHEPHTPPERILKRYADPRRPVRLAAYEAMCEWFDETCGALLDFLDRRGLRERTLVVFVVDNGWRQETGPAQTTRGWYAPRSKSSPYDMGVRTPVMLRWPGRIPAGTHDDLVSTIDLAPTILKACGVLPPPGLPGLSLLDAAAKKEALPRTAVFGEIYTHTAADLGTPALSLTHRWAREEDWKLILPAEGAGGPELYDLASDPHENRNLAVDRAEDVRRLRGLLDAWWRGR